ncbi:MAG TPA: hypothetical protein VM408_08355 [Methylomirabilota bacterium]|nr:hypothetical protein [Methylomirabilota bacterium]
MHPIEFVEIRDGASLDVRSATAAIESATAIVESSDVPPAAMPLVNEPGWSLWGDTDR